MHYSKQHAETPLTILRNHTELTYFPDGSICSLFFISVAIPLVLLFTPTHAGAIQEGNYYYDVHDDHASITNFNKEYAGELSITNTLGDFPVTSIADASFSGCENLTCVTIPNSVSTLGASAFSWCSSLAKCVLSTNITVIEDWTFGGCTNLAGITIPCGVTSIGAAAFQYCGLTNVTIPSSVSTIEGYAFRSCDNLTRVMIGNGVTNISGAAFAYCYGLTNVTIGNSLSTLGDHVFSYCYGLSSIKIPASVTSIGWGAFYDCDNPIRVFFKGNAPDIDMELGTFDQTIIYYLSGTTGWTPVVAGHPAILWNPLFTSASQGSGAISCTVTGTPNIPIVLEATTNIMTGLWISRYATNLTDGIIVFNDSNYTNYSTRYYRIATP